MRGGERDGTRADGDGAGAEVSGSEDGRAGEGVLTVGGESTAIGPFGKVREDEGRGNARETRS